MRSTRGAALATVTAVSAVLLLSALPAPAQELAVPRATPQGACGPGSVPETGLQGRVPAEDVAAGKVANGFRCNVEVVGRHGSSGGFKVERYVDAAGHEWSCCSPRCGCGGSTAVRPELPARS